MVVVERGDKVGGLACTESYRGFRFDMGGHRYNNHGHSMLTAILAVRNLMDGEQHDLWRVNTDAEYHEEVPAAQRWMLLA